MLARVRPLNSYAVMHPDITSGQPTVALKAPSKGRVFGSAVGAISGGLSLFKLGSLLWHLELARAMAELASFYDKVLEPVRVVVGPIIHWFAEEVGWVLPGWWIHVAVLWLVIGGITVRTLSSVDRVHKRQPPGAMEAAVGGVLLSSLGLVLLTAVTAQWVKREIMILIISIDDGVNMKEEVAGYVSPRIILWREVFVTAACAIAFFLFNAFV